LKRRGTVQEVSTIVKNWNMDSVTDLYQDFGSLTVRIT
jgi:hypothetical protein